MVSIMQMQVGTESLGSSGTVTAVPLGLGLLAVSILAVLFWPDYGVVGRLRRSRKLQERVRAEDALKHFYKRQTEGRPPSLESFAGAMGVSLNRAAETLADLQKAGFVSMNGSAMQLTPSGERYALNVIRAHRLWEQHLAEHTGVAETEWHRQAEHQEHFITPEQADSLSAGLGHPTHDPHGDPIPTNRGELARPPGKPLSAFEAGQWARVIHIEDEPEQVYAQIRAMGIYPGMILRLLESTPEKLRVWCDGQEHILARLVAANITAARLNEPQQLEEPRGVLLNQLRPGQKGRVLRISQRCRGAERRRLMDLGILPGTILTHEFQSPAGQLSAYRVRDAVIGLREEQAAQIQIAALESEPREEALTV
jgi:DtxR family Mn-dependent transcriptional regulator